MVPIIQPQPKEVSWVQEIGHAGQITLKGDLSIWEDYGYVHPEKIEGDSIKVDLYLDTCPTEFSFFSFRQYLLGTEGYLIRIQQADSARATVWIKANTKRAYYYALLTWMQVVEQPLYEGWILDRPKLPIRGIVEGYYGKPWSLAERIRAFNVLSRQKMNTYVYAPKNDRYHRDLWRLPYPSFEMGELEKIIHEAKRNELDFVFAVSPGLSIRYHSNEDLEQLIAKFVQIYKQGVRSFGLFFDDIPMSLYYTEDQMAFGSLATAQCKIILSAFARLKELDDSNRLMICPTLYYGEGNEEYIAQLGHHLPKEILILWTGRNICSPNITARESRIFYEATEHHPLYWDNYPVNDANMRSELHIGPYRNRDPKLYLFAQGVIANVMEYAESSLIPLITIANYCWNPEKYDPDECFGFAIKEIVGESTAEVFKYFSDFVDQSALQPLPGQQFMTEWFACQQSWDKADTQKKFTDYLWMRKNQIESLFRMQNNKLSGEIRPWIEETVKDLNALISFFKKSELLSPAELSQWVQELYEGKAKALGYFPYLIMNEHLNMITEVEKP